MSPIPEDLTIVKDDMVAFIEGHGMRRFHGYVDYEEVQCIMWEMGDDVDDARWLRAHLGKVGYLQLGWAYQGSMFLCEVSTEWYERYQHLLEVSDEFGGLTMDEPDQDEEN
jgi:hypothetical protein